MIKFRLCCKLFFSGPSSEFWLNTLYKMIWQSKLSGIDFVDLFWGEVGLSVTFDSFFCSYLHCITLSWILPTWLAARTHSERQTWTRKLLANWTWLIINIRLTLIHHSPPQPPPPHHHHHENLSWETDMEQKAIGHFLEWLHTILTILNGLLL